MFYRFSTFFLYWILNAFHLKSTKILIEIITAFQIKTKIVDIKENMFFCNEQHHNKTKKKSLWKCEIIACFSIKRCWSKEYFRTKNTNIKNKSISETNFRIYSFLSEVYFGIDVVLYWQLYSVCCGCKLMHIWVSKCCKFRFKWILEIKNLLRYFNEFYFQTKRTMYFHLPKRMTIVHKHNSLRSLCQYCQNTFKDNNLD